MRKIENLVFEGGGVLGICYAGAISVLEENNIFGSVKRVAGTSAGSLIALMTSLKYSAADIKEIMSKTNFKDFEDHFDPLRIITKYGLYKGEFLFKYIQKIVSDKTGNTSATFQDLRDAGFKELKVYATDLNTTSVKEFSYQETPTVPVAEAVRASMSIPFFFQAWQFSNNNPDNHIYVDGGTVYNYPINAFGTYDNTLGFAFKAVEVEPNNGLKLDHLLKFTQATFKAVLKSQKININESEEEKEVSVLIDTLGISSTDFKLTNEEQTKLFNSGVKATEAYLAQYINKTATPTEAE